MAHHKSALKRIRQNRRRRLYNRSNKKIAKEVIKSVKNSKTYDEAIQKLNQAYKILDRLAAKGILHKNNTANKKSRLAHFVDSLKTTAI